MKVAILHEEITQKRDRRVWRFSYWSCGLSTSILLSSDSLLFFAWWHRYRFLLEAAKPSSTEIGNITQMSIHHQFGILIYYFQPHMD